MKSHLITTKKLLLIISLIFLHNYCFPNSKLKRISNFLSDSTVVNLKWLYDHYKYQDDLNEIKFKSDTLMIASTEDFFYYPFGIYKSFSKLKGFEQYKLEKKILKDKNLTFYKLSNGKSFITFYKSYETKLIEIDGGLIYDPKISLVNKIKIGLTKKDFCKLLFNDNFINKKIKFNVVELVSGVDGIWHYYNFEKDKLVSFRLKTSDIFKYVFKN